MQLQMLHTNAAYCITIIKIGEKRWKIFGPTWNFFSLSRLCWAGYIRPWSCDQKV